MEKENLDILKTIEQEMDTDVHPLLKMILDNIKAIGKIGRHTSELQSRT